MWTYSTPFKRVGRTNQRLSREETQRLAEATAGRTWDTLPCSGLRIVDIDGAAVRLFLEAVSQDVRASIESVLHNLGMVTPGGISYGAALLFAKNSQRFVPEAQVKCARFAGTTSVKFLDEQTLEGNLLTQPDAAIAFVMRNIRQSILISGRAEHEVVPEYPEEAVREAIVNAICHRDYAAVGTVQVRIYDNRLEVWNPGMLPPDLTIEALYEEHPSRPRNPRVAIAMHRARIMERWGTGTLRMVQACLDRVLPRPEFRSQMGEFIVSFRRSYAPVVPTEAHLHPCQVRALTYAREKGSITRVEYEDISGISKVQAVADLNYLITQDLLRPTGRSRARRYSVFIPPELLPQDLPQLSKIHSLPGEEDPSA